MKYVFGTVPVSGSVSVGLSVDTSASSLRPFGDARSDASLDGVTLSVGSNATNFSIGCFAQVYEQIITSLTVCVLHDEHKYGGKYSTNACDGKIRNHYELDGPKFDPRKEKELM